MKSSRWHGRVEGARDRFAHPGCTEPREFKAPLTPSSFDGPGSWRFLCLDHVREHNARYNFFESMRTMFDRDKIKGMRGTVQFRFGPGSYVGRIHGRGIDIAAGETPTPDLSISASPPPPTSPQSCMPRRLTT